MSDEEFLTMRANFKQRSQQNADSITKEEFVAALHRRSEAATATKELRLEQMTKVATDVAIEFSKRDWVVVHSKAGKSFIDSDEGIFLVADREGDHTGFGPLAPGIATVLPISKNAVLAITSSSSRTITHNDVNGAYVKSINDGLANTSGEIFSHSKELLESIVKRNKLENTTFQIVLDDIKLAEAARKAFKD